jgi:hypothetical protein
LLNGAVVARQNDEQILADFKADKEAIAKLQKDQAEIRRSFEQHFCRCNQLVDKSTDPRCEERATLLQGFRNTLARLRSDGRVPSNVVREYGRRVQALTEMELVIARFTSVRQALGCVVEAQAEYRRAAASFLTQHVPCPSGITRSGRPRIWAGVEGLYLVQAVEEKRKNKKCTLAQAIRWAINTDPRLSRSAIRSKPLRTLEARYQEAFKYWSRDWDEEARAHDRYKVALDRFETAIDQWNLDSISVDAANETLHDATKAFDVAFKQWKAKRSTDAEQRASADFP